MRENTSLPVMIDISLLNLSAPAIKAIDATLKLMWNSSDVIKKYNFIFGNFMKRNGVGLQ